MTDAKLYDEVREFVKKDFPKAVKQPETDFPSNPLWQRMCEAGTEPWLDSGDLDATGKLWTREFSALTTNNTLLNNEVQKGLYDELIKKANEMLAAYNLSDAELRLEIAFILNAYHGLRLAHKYGAYVSVEEHTDLADDANAAVSYGRRFHEICPERFIVKLPFTPAGLLATRRLSVHGIPVNHTLGFSARQNYVIARIGKPSFVNVFLGRLNSLTSSNNLGNGEYVGEKATLASQAAIKQLRNEKGVPTRQIAASIRSGEQVAALAGVDVHTIPPKAAAQFLELGLSPDDIKDRTSEDYTPGINEDAQSLGINTLWDIDEKMPECLDNLEKEDLDRFTSVDLYKFFADAGLADFLVDWTDEQAAASKAEGKIPKTENWKSELSSGKIGLDALINLAGLESFKGDQAAMDQRVMDVLKNA
ncbi:transaldolase family protein [Verrucomicrobiota bacterium]